MTVFPPVAVALTMTMIPRAFAHLFSEGDEQGDGLLADDEIETVILMTLAGSGECTEDQLFAACQWANSAAIGEALLNLVLNKAFFIDMTGSEIAFKVNDSLSQEDLRKKLQEGFGHHDDDDEAAEA